jgi:DNA-binding response OmpR family regulator
VANSIGLRWRIEPASGGEFAGPRKLGAEVYCATNAADGAKLLAAHIFDLAIIDVQLPGQSGVELIEMAVNRDIPVLMITGHADVVEKFLRLNIPALLKPFSIQKIQDEGKRIAADKKENVRLTKEAVAAMKAVQATWHQSI